MEYKQIWVNNKCNFINKYGEWLLDKWVDKCEKSIYLNGYMWVHNYEKGVNNFINCSDYSLLLPFWTRSYHVNKQKTHMQVSVDGKHNIFLIKSKSLLFQEWVDDIDIIGEEYIGIKEKNGKWRIANLNGKYITEEEFDEILCRDYVGLISVTNLFSTDFNPNGISARKNGKKCIFYPSKGTICYLGNEKIATP